MRWLVRAMPPIDEWSEIHPCEPEEIPVSVLNAAKVIGWEGDFSGERAYCFWVPNSSWGLVKCFAWKQNNNGTCFSAVPWADGEFTDAFDTQEDVEALAAQLGH
jgi:hypothetical protein